ncbi:MAG: hypothetical protein ACOX6T_03255 [Myxococcales bacterium]
MNAGAEPDPSKDTSPTETVKPTSLVTRGEVRLRQADVEPLVALGGGEVDLADGVVDLPQYLRADVRAFVRAQPADRALEAVDADDEEREREVVAVAALELHQQEPLVELELELRGLARARDGREDPLVRALLEGLELRRGLSQADRPAR